MNPLTLTLACAALVAAPIGAQQGASAQPLAPYGTPSGGAVNAQPAPGTAAASCGTLEDFEAYTIAAGGAENIGVLTLDENTITSTGQGPGLVIDGCVYSCNGNTLQWNGPGWFGLPTKTFLANTTDGLLILSYDSPVGDVDMSLHAFDGFADSATLTAYDSAGNVLTTVGPVSLPNSTPVPVNVSASGIARIDVQGANFSWSPVIDDHEFCGGGPSLRTTGTCPGSITFSVSGGTGTYALLYGPAGSFTAAGGVCAGTTVDINPPTLGAVMGASLTANVPAAGCGLTVQAVDLGTCAVSNAVVL